MPHVQHPPYLVLAFFLFVLVSQVVDLAVGAAVPFRPQDSNLDCTAPKAGVLPLHQGGPTLARVVPAKSARADGPVTA